MFEVIALVVALIGAAGLGWHLPETTKAIARLMCAIGYMVLVLVVMLGFAGQGG